MVNTSAPFKIGLLWHSLSSDNLGVGALTEAQIAICRSAAQRAGRTVEFIIFGTAGGRCGVPEDTSVRTGSRVSLKQMLLGRSDFLREAAACDLLLDIGEGDSFTDIYGWRRFMFMVFSKLALLRMSKALILAPQTIGPFRSRYSRWLALRAMRGCHYVFTRDALSTQYLASFGVTANVREVTDVAFRLPYTLPAPRNDGRVRVGVNVSGLLFAGGYFGANQFGLKLDYPAVVRGLLRHWAADPTVDLWLVPHVMPDKVPRDDDRLAIATLAQEFPTVQLAPHFATPSQAKTFIAGLDFMTGARMHACIAACSSGVAVVPLAYSRKFVGLFGSLGYRWLVDGASVGTGAAVDYILNAFEQRTELVKDATLAHERALLGLTSYESLISTLLFEDQATVTVENADQAVSL